MDHSEDVRIETCTISYIRWVQSSQKVAVEIFPIVDLSLRAFHLPLRLVINEKQADFT